MQVHDRRIQCPLKITFPGAAPQSGKTSSCQFLGRQGTEEHVDLHNEGTISKIHSGGYSTGLRGQVLQVYIKNFF